MVYKGNLNIDSRGLIYEAYRIEGISAEECRSIFLDWALSAPLGEMDDHLQALLDEYSEDFPDHPMTEVVRQGQKAPAKSARRGGRLGRQRTPQ